MLSESRPNIWMINQNAVTPDMPGGTRHYEFAVELVNQFGCDVTILSSNFNYKTRTCLRKSVFGQTVIEKYNGVNFVWIPVLSYKKNNWRRILNMISFAINLYFEQPMVKSPDIIIGSSPPIFTALSAFFLSIKYQSRFILEVRDLWPQTLIDMGTYNSNDLTIKALRSIEKFLYLKADEIIVFAKGAKNYISKLTSSTHDKKIHFIPNGVHLEHFKPNQNKLKVGQTIGASDEFIIMYAGAHGPANSLDTILNAANLLRHEEGIRFVLVGDGPSKVNLQMSVAKRKLSNVQLCEAVPKNEIPNWLAAADVLVITLKNIDLFSYGVSPNKLFDYMATSKPIICAVAGDMATIVKDAEAGLTIEPEKPDQLAEAIKYLRNNPKQRCCFGKNGYNYLRSNFSRQDLVKKFYENLIF